MSDTPEQPNLTDKPATAPASAAQSQALQSKTTPPEATGTRSSLTWLFIVVAVSLIAAIIYLILPPAHTELDQAITDIKEGKAAFAVQTLENMTRKYPDNTRVYPWLARAYLSTDRLAEGRAALDTALRLREPPETVTPVVLQYAKYYEARGDFEEAERLFQTAEISCAGDNLESGKGSLYAIWAEKDAKDGKLEKAVQHMEQSVNRLAVLDPNLHASIPHRLCDLYRQLALQSEIKDGNDLRAIAILEKSLKVQDEPATRMQLASLYARANNLDKSIENYQAVAKADQNNLEARHHLVDLLCEKKDFQNAQIALADLTDKEKSVENYLLLADVDLKLENYAGAVRALEDANGLRPKPELLKQLQQVLLTWSALLVKQKDLQGAQTIKSRAERVGEQLSELVGDEEKGKDKNQETVFKPGNPPIALVFSRIWLAKGSLTPEGEVKIKNITGSSVPELTLTAVFYDNTLKKTNGSVTLPVSTPTSQPFEAGAIRSLYFSCPNIVKADHQLAVIILWKGHFLKEFPVIKQ